MKILVIEDDWVASEAVTEILCAHHYAVDAIDNGIAGFDLAKQWSYDLILLDVMLPGMNGIEVCRRLRTQNCQVPILMLTSKDSNEDIVQGLDAGADDYVVKSCHSSQLLARVRALLRRSGNSTSSPILTWGALTLDPAAARVSYCGADVGLRPKEYALLELFLRHPDRILSRGAIIDHLWSMEDTPVEGSITNLIKDLRQRLKSAGMTADLIETVYGLGYRLGEAPAVEETTQDNRKQTKNVSNTVPASSLAIDTDCDRNTPTQKGSTKIQLIAERFQESLKQRIATLEAAVRSLQTGNLTLEQRIATQTEVHKLSGGLGTFGCSKASEIAKAIEDLLEVSSSQEALLVDQLPQLLGELKQALVANLTDTTVARR